MRPILLALLLATTPVIAKSDDPALLNTTDWVKDGKAALDARLAEKPITHRAKNVILFIGDGMGISTVTAGRIYDGQSNGAKGEENSLSFEKFPNLALVKTYNTDAQVPDSAGTASAFNTGTKTNIGAISVWPDQDWAACETGATFPKTLVELAEMKGLSTGIISTASITDATPAATYSHSPSRKLQSDADVASNEIAAGKGCKDIASQLIDFPYGDGPEIVIGGGRMKFLPDTAGGERKDGRNLVAEWSAKPGHAYVSDAAGLKAWDPAKTPHLLGLMAPENMSYVPDREYNPTEPGLVDMTEAAIRSLSRNDKGYFLMVEGGLIDKAHHGGNAARALADTQELSRAVARAAELTKAEDTLIIVTADHSHVFVIAGYAPRGNPILGVAGKGADGRDYTTLGYWNGPGFFTPRPVAATKTDDVDYLQQAAINLKSETHGGEDVAAFARGPMSYLVSGVMEQNVLFHVMAHALGFDDGK